jgi:uncharacterized protein (TIGR03067 family)
MNGLFGQMILLVFVPIVVGDDKPPATLKIRGRWEVVASTFNGTTFTHCKGRVLIFNDGEISTEYDDVSVRAVEYTVDVAADPNRIDLIQDDAGKKALGIYSIEKDELRLCYGEPGAEHPAKFESKPGDRVFLVVLKRVKH